MKMRLNEHALPDTLPGPQSLSAHEAYDMCGELVKVDGRLKAERGGQGTGNNCGDGGNNGERRHVQT